MPFLRFSRDKRGYENTYLCHTFRRSGTPHLRVLYWFRTPPNVEIGRLALDPATIRAIEESNPDLRFDWDEILKVKPPPPSPDPAQDGRAERRGRRRRGRPTAAGPGGDAPPAPAPPTPTADSVRGAGNEPPPAAPPPEPPEVDPWEPTTDDGTEEGPKRHAVLALIDAEGLARLRARHAEIQARINEREREPDQLEALQTQAALLDPDTWSTLEVARERLESLEQATEALRKQLGRRRTRRGGRRRQRRPDAGAEAGSSATDPEPGPAPTDVVRSEPSTNE